MSGYTGPFGNQYSYLRGNGPGVTGMPAGTNNANAFMTGVTGSYLTVGAAMSRRGTAVYSNLSSAGSFGTRLSIPGTVSWPARIGPALGIFRNTVGQPTNPKTTPY